MTIIHKPALTINQLQAAADDLGVELACIQAVADVESRGSGFFASGKPSILFEAHVFYDQLKRRGIDPVPLMARYPNIISRKWNRSLYGPAGDYQYTRLDHAITINKDAALCSASWGAFQIMGFNYASVGWATPQEFADAMFMSVGNHLRAFVGFIKANNLSTYLQQKNWSKFAERYNGPDYKVNGYDSKMAAAYKKFSEHKA